MDRKRAVPAFLAIAVAAGAFGVHLGESAIATINPLYFQGAAVHPRDRGVVVDDADFVAKGPRFAELYGWEQGGAARSLDCGDCEALAARDAYAGGGGTQYAVLEADWRSDPRPASADLMPETLPAEEGPSAFELQRAEIRRYAYAEGDAPKTERAEAPASAPAADEADLEGL